MATSEAPTPAQELDIPDFMTEYPPDVQAQLNSYNGQIEKATHQEIIYKAAGHEDMAAREREFAAHFTAMRTRFLEHLEHSGREQKASRVGQLLHQIRHLLDRE